MTVSRSSGVNPAATLLLVVGAVVLLLGAIMLVSLALVVVDVLKNPDDVALIAMVMEKMQTGGGAAIGGHLGELGFELRVDEPLRTLLFLVVCVWALGALASILKTIVMTGKDLLDRGRDHTPR